MYRAKRKNAFFRIKFKSKRNENIHVFEYFRVDTVNSYLNPGRWRGGTTTTTLINPFRKSYSVHDTVADSAVVSTANKKFEFFKCRRGFYSRVRLLRTTPLVFLFGDDFKEFINYIVRTRPFIARIMKNQPDSRNRSEK